MQGGAEIRLARGIRSDEDHARATLGEEAFEAAWTDGYAMTIDEMLELARRRGRADTADT